MDQSEARHMYPAYMILENEAGVEKDEVFFGPFNWLSYRLFVEGETTPVEGTVRGVRDNGGSITFSIEDGIYSGKYRAKRPNILKKPRTK